jgi:hypothetical protein
VSTVQTGRPEGPSRAMALLASGVPLSLLLDLAFGPRSEDLLAERPRQPELPELPEPQPA